MTSSLPESEHQLANQLADIEFWLRPDVPVWRYSKDELLEQHREVTAGLQAKREGEGTMRALPGDWITR